MIDHIDEMVCNCGVLALVNLKHESVFRVKSCVLVDSGNVPGGHHDRRELECLWSDHLLRIACDTHQGVEHETVALWV